MINQVPVTHAKGHVFHQERLAGVCELNAVHCGPMSGVSEATFWLLLCTKNLKEFWSFLFFFSFFFFLGSCRISDKPDHSQDFALMKHDHSWAKKFCEKLKKEWGPKKFFVKNMDQVVTVEFSVEKPWNLTFSWTHCAVIAWKVLRNSQRARNWIYLASKCPEY